MSLTHAYFLSLFQFLHILLFLILILSPPFNSCFTSIIILAIAIGKSGCIPYAEIESGRLSITITGISKPIQFQVPKTFRVNQLQYLLDSKENFQLTGMTLLIHFSQNDTYMMYKSLT